MLRRIHQQILLPALTALVLLTACSRDEELTVVDPRFNADGEGYLSIDLNICGSGKTTRAVSYENGDAAEEYEIKKAYFVLLKDGDSGQEDDAIITSAYPIESEFTDATADQLTKQGQHTVKINRNDVGLAGAYAMVIINPNDQLWIDKDNQLRFGTERGLVGSAILKGETFGQFKDRTITIEPGSTIASTGMLMMNAPVSTKPGGSSNPANSVSITTLAPLDLQMIFATESEAEGNSAASIFVERTAAKVQVIGDFGSNGKVEDTDITFDKDKIRWTLDNYNTESYPVRHMPTDEDVVGASADGTSRYRMVEANPLLEGYYRTNWAEDINYTGDDKNDELVRVTSTTSIDKELGEYVYCAENTMDADNLKQDRTTRVVVEATLNGGSDFYAMAVRPKMLITETDQTKLRNLLIKEMFRKVTPDDYAYESGWLKQWVNYFISDPFNFYPVSEQIHEDGSSLGATNKLEFSDLKYDETTGTYYVTVTGFDKSLMKADQQANYESALNELNQDGHIPGISKKLGLQCYKDGKCYYPILIRHFDSDTETPWAATSTETGYDKVYPAAKRMDNYLGRYGVVRNHWYVIKLKGIKQIGRSTPVPGDKETPDDLPEEEEESPDYYLDYQIEIVPWTVHSQTFDFE